MKAQYLALGLAVGLGTSAAPRVSLPGTRQVAKATATVTNNNVLDVDVFVSVGETRYRLGTVVTSQTADLNLPDPAIGNSQIRMVADPVGSREAYVSEQLTVNDGDRILFTIANHLPQSTVRVGRVAF